MDTMVLPEESRTSLKASLQTLALHSPYEDLEGFLTTISPAFASLPPRLRERLRAFRNDPRAQGAMVLRNLPIDDELPPTPLDGRPSRDKTTFVSEACVLGICQILGEPMGYRDEKEGDVIQALCPVPAEAHATSSESSDVELGFHTDFNFDPQNPERPYNVLNPDYIVLLCLRGDPEHEAYTLYADARDICRQLAPAQLELMRAPVFQFAASYSFTRSCADQKIWSVPSPLLTGPPEFPEVSIDLLCGVRGMSEEANALLDQIKEVCRCPGVATSVCLTPGELLIIDNRKGAHARTAFTALFDGHDRWLHRVYVRRSLWELRGGSSWGVRVF
jgi:L-asparagine oxygenase